MTMIKHESQDTDVHWHNISIVKWKFTHKFGFDVNTGSAENISMSLHNHIESLKTKSMESFVQEYIILQVSN